MIFLHSFHTLNKGTTSVINRYSEESLFWMFVLWGMSERCVLRSVWRAFVLWRRPELSPPHVFVVDGGSDCCKAGCRSSSSLAALDVLVGNGQKNKVMEAKSVTHCQNSRFNFRFPFEETFFFSNAERTQILQTYSYFCVQILLLILMTVMVECYIASYLHIIHIF